MSDPWLSIVTVKCHAQEDDDDNGNDDNGNGDDGNNDNGNDEDDEGPQTESQEDEEEEGGSIQAIIDLLPLAAPILEDLSDVRWHIDKRIHLRRL